MAETLSVQGFKFYHIFQLVYVYYNMTDYSSKYILVKLRYTSRSPRSHYPRLAPS